MGAVLEKRGSGIVTQLTGDARELLPAGAVQPVPCRLSKIHAAKRHTETLHFASPPFHAIIGGRKRRGIIMHLRQFEAGDLPAVQELFAGSIRTVCRGDYTPAELEAWANRAGRITAERLLDCYTLVAEEEGRLLGFGNLEPGGHLDCLYTAADSQRRGVAAALCDALEAEARRQGEELLRVEASRTARGFFERRGYQVAAAQLVPVDGEELENFRMAKKLDKTVSHKTNA